MDVLEMRQAMVNLKRARALNKHIHVMWGLREDALWARCVCVGRALREIPTSPHLYRAWALACKEDSDAQECARILLEEPQPSTLLGLVALYAAKECALAMLDTRGLGVLRAMESENWPLFRASVLKFTGEERHAFKENMLGEVLKGLTSPRERDLDFSTIALWEVAHTYL